MNDDCHSAFTLVSNWVTDRSDLVYTVEFLKMAYGTSLEPERRSWISNVEKAGLYESKSPEWTYMPQIGSPKHWNITGVGHPSLSRHVSRWIRIWKALKLLHAMSIHRDHVLGVNHNYLSDGIQLFSIEWLGKCVSGECEYTVNNFLTYAGCRQWAA